jgi:spore maturation protein CgeB
VAGDFAWEFYEPAFCWGLREAGARVEELRVGPLFGPGDLLRRAQRKLVVGPGVAVANAALLARCAAFKPDVVLAWRAPWLSPATVRLARHLGARQVALYNNDDPFGPDRSLRIWRRFRRSIPAANVCFAYRSVNVAEYRDAGARRVELLRSWYDPRLHRPMELPPVCDVLFAGHYEPDDRIEVLNALHASGLRLRIVGGGWERLDRREPIARLLPIAHAVGEDYVRAIAAAKVALVFLSKRNRDQYTRRCFEIPAIGTLMLAPRTPELLAMYREGEEAAFFSNAAEALKQATRFVQDEGLRRRVAAAGRARCRADGHDVASRARQFLRDLGLAGAR